MWIFAPFGVFSIVSNGPWLVVRSRAREDIDAFVSRLRSCGAGHGLEVQTTPERDYPYRIEAAPIAVAKVISSFVEDEIDYDNFKLQVSRKQGAERAETYHLVWRVLEERFRSSRPIKMSKFREQISRIRRAPK